LKDTPNEVVIDAPDDFFGGQLQKSLEHV